MQDRLPDPTQCDCWRLTRVLHDGEPLPDHVCEAAMRANIAAFRDDWLDHAARHVMETGVQLADEYLGLPLSGAGNTLQPRDRRGAEFFDKGAQQHVNAFSQLADLKAYTPAVWPLPWWQRQLAFVVHEWVQDEPSETLANQLHASSGWHTSLRMASAAKTTEEWLVYLSNGLRDSGLPFSPLVVGHAEAFLRGEREPLPAVGVKILTYVFLPQHHLLLQLMAEESDAFPDPSAILKTVSPNGLAYGSETEIGQIATEWITGPMLQRVSDAVRRHRDWVRTLAPHPDHTLSTIRRSQPGAMQRSQRDDSWYDYAAEAERGAGDFIATLSPRANKEAAFSAYLTSVQKRVQKRRQKAGLPSRPASDWTTQARAMLRSRIVEHPPGPR